MSKAIKIFLGVVLTSLCAQLAQANTSATITVASNYIWRGLTFSGNGAMEAAKGLPVVQGSFDKSFDSGFGLGLFVGGVDTVNYDTSAVDRDNEFDPTVSYSYQLNEELSLFAAVTGYTYVLNSSNNTVDYQTAVIWKGFRLDLSYIDNYFGTKSSDFYTRMSYRHAVSEKVSVVAHVGSTSFGDEDLVGFKNYIDYKAGLSFSKDIWTADVFYSATNRKDLVDEDINDKAVVLALSLSL